MAALPGGDADKLGNRYEGWWTMLRLVDVLTGKASRLRLEPPGPVGEGIEFWVDEAEARWCEQVKDVPSGGTWTVRRLISQGVLASVQHHLAEGHRVRLVLSTFAPDMADLTERASKSTSAEEFVESTVTKELLPELERVLAAWAVGQETAWQYLARVQVEVHPSDALRRLLLMQYERLVDGDPQDTILWLGSWLTDHMQEVLTGPQVWGALTASGRSRVLLPGDPTTTAALAATVERNQQRLGSAAPDVTVTSPHLQQLLDLLTGEDAPQVVIVHGRAGSGKSTVAAQAVNQLHQAGWYAAVVRMDLATGHALTARALGQACDLSGSPVVLLGGVSDGSPAVLMVDQLDAVSSYSGRLSDGYDAVAETLRQAAMFPALKVVLAARTVDLNEDPRLRELLTHDRTVSVALADLSPGDVRAALAAAGVDTGAFTEATLVLLCVPLHLAVFRRLSETAQRQTYASLSALYEEYTEQQRRHLEAQHTGFAWSEITRALVAAMNDRETLQVPTGVLERFQRAHVAALVSSGILASTGRQLGFFHETYFDFLFAQAFVNGGEDLHDFLVKSGQPLFRRAQTRQVLDYLASTDRSEFRRTVVKLLSSGDIRPHVKEVVTTFLRQVDADAEDWLSLEPLMLGEGSAARYVVPLLSVTSWFDAVDDAGRWAQYVAAPDTGAGVYNQLIFVARERGARVAELVAPYIASTPEWTQRLRALVQWSLGPDLVDLAVDLVERGELDGTVGPIAANADFFSLIYGLAQEDPAGAARVVGAHLRRGLTQAQAAGHNDPFTSGDLQDHSPSGDELIAELANKAPQTYVDQLLHVIADLIESAPSTDDGALRHSRRWSHRYVGDLGSITHALFTGLDTALRALAVSDIAGTIDLADGLAASSLEPMRFLAARTYAALPDGGGDAAVTFLLAGDSNLELGYADSPRWASRELVAAVTAACADIQLAALTERLGQYVPAWELGPEGLQRRGQAEYELLSAVDVGRRSADVTRRLGELERKFPQAPPRPPQPMGLASFIGSPICDTDSLRMTDNQWLGAISRYAVADPPRSAAWNQGGTRELASQLGRRAAEDPGRFAALALRFDATTPSVHLIRVIEAVAGLVPLPLLSELCLHAHQCAGPEVLNAVARAVERAAEADEPLLELLEAAAAYDENIQVAPDPDPDPLFSAGYQLTKGAAARAIAVLWFAGPDHVARLLPVVAALVADPEAAVRAAVANAVAALLNHDQSEALNLAHQLMDAGPVEVFGVHAVADLLAYSVFRDPGRFADQLGLALDGPAAVAQLAGRIWAGAFVRDCLAPPQTDDVTALTAPARLGAAEVLAKAPLLALPVLTTLLSDDDPDVRSAAAHAATGLSELETDKAEQLLAAFTASASFAEHYDLALHPLAESTRVLPASALAACEIAVAATGAALGDMRTGHAGAAGDIATVVLRVYRQSGVEDVRRRCLDLIDALCEVRAYGLDEKLEEAR